MTVSFSTLNVLACATFFAMFVACIHAAHYQFVSDFWAELNVETHTATYIVVMWLLALAAPSLLIVDPDSMRTLGALVRAGMDGGLLEGTVAIGSLAIWLTANLLAAIFAVGAAVAYLWLAVRRLLKTPVFVS